jgi:hypothetical protein
VRKTVLGLEKKTTLRLWLVVAAMLLACGALLGSAAAVPCGPSWSTVPSAAELKTPEAIAPIASNDIWVVGNKGLDKLEAGKITTGAEHWDGNAWTLFPTPNAGSQTSLVGADALSSDDVWAVGYYTNDQDPNELNTGFYKTLVQHWDGTGWQLVTSPNVGQFSNSLADVDALRSDLAWAVGYYRQDKTHRKTLLLRWNGTSWSVIPSPSPGTLSNALLGVAAIDDNDAWAVGYKKSGGAGGYRSLVLHYDGTAWTEVEGVPAVGGDNVLTGVSAVSGDDIWAAGYYVEGTQHKTLTLHYDGAVWERVASANEGGAVTALRDVDASSPTDAWGVGLRYQATRNRFVASTQHWDGSSWSLFPPAIGNVKSEMLAVGKAPGTSQVWAAGRPANVETICLPDGTVGATSEEESDTTTTSSSSPTSAKASIPGEQTASASEATAAMAVTAVDKAADAGISEATLTRGAVMADFDNDGLQDIFLNRHLSVSRLYINDGNGHFTETNTGTFVKTDRHGCSAADVNTDGLMDLSCTTSGARGTQAKANELYVQQPDHTFVDQAEQYGVLEPFARGRSATFIDADGDPYPDLYTASDPDRADGLPSSNRFFINEGGSAYRYAPEFGLEYEVSDGSSSGGTGDVGDLDKDGWQDLVVETSSGLRVYHNDGGTGFTDVAGSVGLGQRPLDTVLADVNGDGWLDVIEVMRGKLRVLLNTTEANGTLSFSSAFSTKIQYDLSVAAGDVNGDNRADIYVMRGKDGTGANAPDQVYLNDGSGKSFTPMSIPSTDQGLAEAVVPIDYDGNGLSDFLALNGNGRAEGPVQLIAFYPAP